MYVGTYEHHIDSKGRIILPGAFRQALGTSFIISAGFDRCLALWRAEDWSAFVQKEVSRRSDLSSEARRLSRWLHSSAHNVELDAQSRFVVPPPLRNGIPLQREIVLAGAGSRIEVWPLEIWTEYIQKTSGAIEEIAENLSRDLSG